jgi:transposase-like protein
VEYSDSFKAQMVKKMLAPSGISATILVEKVGVSQPTLSKWKREALEAAGMSTPPPTAHRRAATPYPVKTRPRWNDPKAAWTEMPIARFRST